MSLDILDVITISLDSSPEYGDDLLTIIAEDSVVLAVNYLSDDFLSILQELVLEGYDITGFEELSLAEDLDEAVKSLLHVLVEDEDDLAYFVMELDSLD